MAVALSWKGYADTDLKFSEFFSADHTLVLRFMSQFPHAYEGPMVAENGTGEFAIGQGDFLASVGVSGSPGVGSLGPENAKLAYAFMRTDEDSLFVTFWDGSKWRWSDQGRPPPRGKVKGNPGVVALGTERIYAFVGGTGGRLYVNFWNGSKWQWADQGHPPGTTMVDTPGVIVYGSERIYAFVRGANGRLCVNFWDGSKWQWADQGAPPDTTMVDSPGVIAYGSERIYAFVRGANGHLCVNFWNGSKWQWADQGAPPDTTMVDSPGVIAYGSDRIYAFVRGTNGRLYVNFWDGSKWQWADQGRPKVKVTGRPGVIALANGRIGAFVRGANGRLYVNVWDGSKWEWADQDHPEKVAVAESPGVVAHGKEIHAFVRGANNLLYVNVWDGSQWHWRLAETWGTRLLLSVGSRSKLFPTKLEAGQWHHLAVVARASGPERIFSVYLDGMPLGLLSVPANDSLMPGGSLRFGKRTTGKRINARDAQCFGLLDDVAIFTRALSTPEVQDLSENVPNLTSSLPDLLAGYPFATGRLPSKLARPVILKGAAQRVTTSADRNSASDAALLPLPTMHEPMDLPFPPGEAWDVIKGVDTDGEHHDGYASFCWDFNPHGKPVASEYPDGCAGAPLYAAAPGSVVFAREDQPAGTTVPNLLEIEQAPEEICGYMHARQDSLQFDVNDAVLRGQKVALNGSTGMGDCGGQDLDMCTHLHFGVVNQLHDTPGFVTFPIAFRDYEVRTGAKTWKSVSRGMPSAGQVVRRPPTSG